jgi:hypothetical protein
MYVILVVEGDRRRRRRRRSEQKIATTMEPSQALGKNLLEDELSAIALSVNGATEEYLCVYVEGGEVGEGEQRRNSR